LAAHPDDGDDVEQCHKGNEHGDECAVSRTDRPLSLSFGIHCH